MQAFPANLGLVTDLALHAEEGTVETHGDYLVVRIEHAPDYFFGNLLVLPRRPRSTELGRLEADFARLVGEPPRITHRTFVWPESWPSAPGHTGNHDEADLDAFIAKGYDATMCRVLVAGWDDVCTLATNPMVEVRRYASPGDWDTWMRMHFDDMSRAFDAASTQRYLAQRQQAYRRMIERSLGDWWGAFIDGEQVGNLGLFFIDGVGRFQTMLTDERYRNRKVCRTLVSEAIRQARAADAAKRASPLVMVADEDHHAGQIYERLGFRPQARLASLCRAPQPVGSEART